MPIAILDFLGVDGPARGQSLLLKLLLLEQHGPKGSLSAGLVVAIAVNTNKNTNKTTSKILPAKP